MFSFRQPSIVLRGAGDLATGIALRLYRAGYRSLILLEQERPLAVRRHVAFSEAVYEGYQCVEGVTAALASSYDEIKTIFRGGCIPVLVDPKGLYISRLHPDVLIEATLAKHNIGVTRKDAPLVIGVGPGFTAGLDVHCVIETCRGHSLGRVLYSGQAIPNTGIPGEIAGVTTDRLLRAPAAGTFRTYKDIAESVRQGEIVGWIASGRERVPVYAKISGTIRGLLRSGTPVPLEGKLGDIDPRFGIPCHQVSDKALAVGGGVLEALLHFINRTSSVQGGILQPFSTQHSV